MPEDAYNIESGEDKAWRELAAAGPESVVKRSLAAYDAASGSYTLTVFGEEYLVSPATRTISNLSNPSRADEILLRLAVPVYLVNARAVEPSGVLVKEFTGGEIFLKGTHVLPTDEIAKKYGSDGDYFLRAGMAELGGAPVRLGDAAIGFRPFPRVSMTMILWLMDEEFPARASLLFDGNADRHMPIDVVWAAALLACERMLKILN
ncbi:MAG: DUF3786 domain-containing protein [Nitrospirae bacterium]|nr:DUF3786 domain-containing protein [Nitrospirota bacterium]MBI5694163.1 DUF3786 domain-containing protein [Nitrospirota bacterium]